MSERQYAYESRSNGAIADDSTLDDVNRRLLAELQDDARLTLAELGRRVGLSAPAVAERLAAAGGDRASITGYRAEVDPRALGFALTRSSASARRRASCAKVAELARGTPEVVECHRITGDDCYFMKPHVRDVEHLEEVIDRFALYGQTTTSIMQSSPVPAARRGARDVIAATLAVAALAGADRPPVHWDAIPFPPRRRARCARTRAATTGWTARRW